MGQTKVILVSQNDGPVVNKVAEQIGAMGSVAKATLARPAVHDRSREGRAQSRRTIVYVDCAKGVALTRGDAVSVPLPDSLEQTGKLRAVRWVSEGNRGSVLRSHRRAIPFGGFVVPQRESENHGDRRRSPHGEEQQIDIMQCDPGALQNEPHKKST